jgi:hypothetical protein
VKFNKETIKDILETFELSDYFGSLKVEEVMQMIMGV